MSGHIKRGGWLAIALIGCLAMASSAHAASFDCAKAQTKVEKLICEPYAVLSKLDEELNTAYQWAMMRTENKRRVTVEQRHWLKTVRNACEDKGCLLNVYEARINELTAQARGNGCYTLTPITKEKGNVRPIEPVCLALEKNLNRFCGQPPMACGLKIAPEFRDQIILPTWTPLDPKANRALIEEFIRAPWQDVADKNVPNQMWELERPYIEKALAENRLSFSQAKLDLYNLGEAQTAYRLGFGDCEANNPQFSDRERWDEKIHPASVQIHHAPEVVRPLFKRYFPLQHEPLNEAFLYAGKVYDFGMGGVNLVVGATIPGKKEPLTENWLGVNRRERWTNPGNKKIRLSMDNICRFNYQPTQGEIK